MHKYIHQIEEKRQAIFVGFFGPIGVSAIFYLYISIEYLETITVDGIIRDDAATLIEVVTVVVWFLAICSIVVHGLSIPLGKLGFFLPRTLSRAFTNTSSMSVATPPPFTIPEQTAPPSPRTGTRPVYRIGGTVIRDGAASGSRTPAEPAGTSPGNGLVDRTIRFPDEATPAERAGGVEGL